MTPLIVVRADASAAIGLGHAMRCLALAQALADERAGTAVFLMDRPPAAFAERAAREGCAVVPLRAAPGTPDDAAETAALAADRGAAWVVLDGYGFDGAYEAAIARPRVLAFDDHGHTAHRAELVLNQNLGADAVRYPPGTPLLLGPRYALLRREFRDWNGAPRPVPAVARRVLVTLGGSDPANVSARALAGLDGVGVPLEVLVLVGGANPNLAALEQAAAACRHPVELAVDVLDVPARMAWADLAVAAAGGTAWELARVGTPQLAITLAENQRPAGRALGATGAAIALGWHADLTPAAIGAAVADLAADQARRAALAAGGRALIDGRGAVRVLAAMGLVA